jgi:hypothetical protein
VVVFVVLLLGGGTWAYARYFRTDPRVREIEALQTRIEQMAPANGGPPNFEQVRPAMEEIRVKIEALPEGKKEQVEDTTRQRMFAHMQQRDRQRMAQFFALPPAERMAALDKEIDEQEARRAQWAKRMAESQNAAPSGAEAKQAGTAGPSSIPVPPGPGNPPSRGGGRDTFHMRMANMTPERRKEMSRRFLDNSTPEHRAQRTEYIRLVQQRRKERGLADAPAGPFGFGPPPGAVAIPVTGRPAP